MDDLGSVGVLVVEPMPAVRSMLRTVLSLNDGWHLAGETAGGAEAVQLARELQPDAVLMAVHLQSRAELGVFRFLRAAAPAAALVGLASDEVRSEDRLALMARGADEVLEKGTALIEMREAVRSAVRRRRAAI